MASKRTVAKETDVDLEMFRCGSDRMNKEKQDIVLVLHLLGPYLDRWTKSMSHTDREEYVLCSVKDGSRNKLICLRNREGFLVEYRPAGSISAHWTKLAGLRSTRDKPSCSYLPAEDVGACHALMGPFVKMVRKTFPDVEDDLQVFYAAAQRAQKANK